jgi:hypothetical protein
MVRLFERVKNIILKPKTEWPVIKGEPTTISQIYKGYIIPLAAFSALMSFVHMSVVGIALFRMPAHVGLIFSLVNFVFGLLGLYVVGWIIDMLAPTFTGQRDRRQAVKTAAYAFTPVAAGSVFVLLGLRLGSYLQLAAVIWAIYVLYLGLPVLMRGRREKAAGYTAAVVVCVILLGVLFFAVMSAVTSGIAGGDLRFPPATGTAPASAIDTRSAWVGSGASSVINGISIKNLHASASSHREASVSAGGDPNTFPY